MAYRYLQIEDHIKTEILTGKIEKGQKISSESELARKFNLSRQTIRTAISNLVKSGLLYSVQGKGTFVAQNESKKRKTNLIGFATMGFNDYNIFPKIISGINSKTTAQGYSLLIGETKNTMEGEYNCLNNFLDKKIDALIMEPCKSALPCLNLDIYKEFGKKGIPVIFYNGYHSDLDLSYIIVDDRQGGYLATKHLLDYGHRNICSIFKIDDMQGQSRHHGFATAFREYNLPVPEDNVLWFTTDDGMSFWNISDESGKLDNLIMEKIKKSTALVAYNDYVTVRVIKLLQKHGIKFPDEFSIVSFDDTNITSFSGVSITSIEHPSYQLGEELGAAVLELLCNPAKIIRQTIPTAGLVIKDSTRPLEI